jgi:hypothetical protein
MDGRYGGPPVASVVNEVGPELAGGEAWWDHDACTCSQRREKTTHETVYVEEWHNEVGSVGCGKIVGVDDVRGCSEEVAVSQRDTLRTGEGMEKTFSE